MSLANETQAPSKPKMDISRFFSKSTPTSRPVEATSTTVFDMTSNKNANQSGSTPTISKVLFASNNPTISATKDKAQVQGGTPEKRTVPRIIVTKSHDNALSETIDLSQDRDALLEEENDEVSRLEGSPARSENMASDSEEQEQEQDVQEDVQPFSQSSLQHPTPASAPAALASSSASALATSATHTPATLAFVKEAEHGVQSSEQVSVLPLALTPLKVPQQEDVGRSVEVFWPEENSWYAGIIDKFRDARGQVVRELPPAQQQEGSEEEGGEGGCEQATSAVDSPVDTVKIPQSSTEEEAASTMSSASRQGSYHISYEDGDDEWIDGEDLCALVFCDEELTARALRRAEVEAALAPLSKGKKPKKPRAARKPKAAQEGAGAAKGRGRGKSKSAAAAAAPRPLAPDVLLRVRVNEQKLSSLVADLCATRDLVLAHHRRLYNDAVSSSRVPAQSPLTASEEVSGDANEEQQRHADADEKHEGAEEEQDNAPRGLDEAAVQHLVALAVQDSPRALSSLVDSLREALCPLLFTAAITGTDSASGSAVATTTSSQFSWASKYCEALTLAEYIKSIALRTSYGFRSSAEVKQTSLFEDEAELALWRWEVVSLGDMAITATATATATASSTTSTAPAGSEGGIQDEDGVDQAAERAAQRLALQTSEALKSFKTDCQRVGKAVKSVQRVVAELHRAAATSSLSAGAKAKAVMVGESTLDAASEVLLAGLEDKATKALADVQRAQERRLQAEKKWEQSAEESEAKERRRQAEADRKQLMRQKKQELQEAQQHLKQTKTAVSEEAKQAKAAVAALQGDSKRKTREEAEEEAARKKVKVPSEKELKAQALLAKQKSMMSSFFKCAPTPAQPSIPAANAPPSTSTSTNTTTTTTTSLVQSSEVGSSFVEGDVAETDTLPIDISAENCSLDCSPQQSVAQESNVIDLTVAPTATATSAAPTAPCRVLPSRKPQRLTAAEELMRAAREARPLDAEDFERNIDPSAPLSMGDISRLYRSRYSGRPVTKKTLRKPATLSIMVTVEQQPVFVPGEGFRGPTAFEMAMGGGGQSGCGGYSELREVLVDSRKRLFSFSEDLRPPYYGTFSKKSVEVTGRRPFAKDASNNIDYDVDSEAEWEEEEEGEDIIMSEDEDDEEGNDIVYDEFFCPDDEVVYADADPRGGGGGEGGGSGKAEADSVNAIFNAMKNRGGAGERELQSSIAGVRFLGSEHEGGVGTGEVDVALLSRYCAVLDPCGYWSPLPEDRDKNSSCAERDVHVMSPALRAVPHPALLLTTPSLATAALPAERTIKGESRVEPAKEKAEKIDYRQFQDALLPCLASFLHGRRGGLDKTVDAFCALWTPLTETLAATAAAATTTTTTTAGPESSQGPGGAVLSPPESVPVPPSKTQIRSKIKEVAKYVQMGKVSRWVVQEEALAKCSDELQQTLALVDFSPEKDKTAVAIAASIAKNATLSFPVVSASAAIESMASALPLSVPPTAPAPDLALATTPSKDKDSKEGGGRGQASLLTFFRKPAKASSPTPSCLSGSTSCSASNSTESESLKRRSEDAGGLVSVIDEVDSRGNAKKQKL